MMEKAIDNIQSNNIVAVMKSEDLTPLVLVSPCGHVQMAYVDS